MISSEEIMLGSSWMQNHDIIFDLERKKIGLINANCTKFEGNHINRVFKRIISQESKNDSHF